MAEATLVAPPDKAIDAVVEKASEETRLEGTPTDDVTVQGDQGAQGEVDAGAEGDEETEDPDAPKYSESTLAAERDKARAEAKRELEAENKAKEQAKAHAATQERLKSLYPATQRAIKSHLEALSVTDSYGNELKLADSDIAPVQSVVQGLYESALDAAEIEIKAIYEGAINDALGDKAADFWSTVNPNGKGVKFDAALDEFVARKALAHPIVTDADPEDLIKANAKLKAHIATDGDKREAKGRRQGQKDPVGARGGDQQTSNQTVVHDAAWAATAPIAEVNAWLATQS